MNPIVSVVIPHFNRSALLRGAIDSVMASGRSDVEVIVVDDGSRNQEWKKVQQYSGGRIKVIQRTDGAKGPSRCRNIGVHAASGVYVLFLDSDDVIAPWCIDKRLAHAADAPGFDFWVFPVLLFKESPGDDDTLWGRMGAGRDSAASFVSGAPPWHTSSPLWTKAALLSIGGFNEKVFYGDDADLHLRALVSGLKPRAFADALPDAFVRRSAEPRITNSLTSELVESRRIRLREGTQFLKTHIDGTTLLHAWQSQYFIEGEFLLFNFHDDGKAIGHVLSDWENAFSPSAAMRMMVRSYFSLGRLFRERAYLVLRVARRAAMMILPTDFFPKTVEVFQPNATIAVMDEIRTRMRNV